VTERKVLGANDGTNYTGRQDCYGNAGCRGGVLGMAGVLTYLTDGFRTLPVRRAAYVKDVLLVSDEDIVRAQRKLWDALRIAAEPGGAAALAALLSGRYPMKAGERVGVVICGGNTEELPKAP